MYTYIINFTSASCTIFRLMYSVISGEVTRLGLGCIIKVSFGPFIVSGSGIRDRGIVSTEF